MQVIAGVHFNYSLPESFWPAYRSLCASELELADFRSEQYLAMIRNFRRMGWIVLYLFGASPVVCKSFALGDASLQSLNDTTWYEPWATSLRMSDLGYSNQNQSRINISLNSLDEYVEDLSNAICTAEPAYEDIGIKVDGKYRQLNANLLQIENEYYSPVRPKRVAKSGEQPTAALRREGIEYVEIRSLDINMFDPAGINQNTMRFIEAFLIYCLLEDSPRLDATEMQEIAHNHTGTAKRGRDPEFRLHRDGKSIEVRKWATEILAGVHEVAAILDQQDGDRSYREAVHALQVAVDNPDATLSAKIIAELRDTDQSFFEFALGMAQCHRDYFASISPLEGRREQVLAEEATDSLRRQQAIEEGDRISFDEYLQQYFSAC